LISALSLLIVLSKDQIYRKLIAVVFITAFFTQTFGKVFIVADYFTNKSKYAKNCVNKARPKLHCDGKCQLMKKLQEEDKKDQQQPERRLEYKNEISLIDENSFSVHEPYSVALNLPFNLQLLPAKPLNGYYSKVFHPPCFH
jgi:hypothetical protein